MPMQCFIHLKSPFLRTVFLVEKFPSLVLPRNTIMCNIIVLSYYSIYLFIICRVVAYERLKTKENFKLIALISGRGRLQEVVAY